MMPYYILREVPEGRGLLANTVYSGQQIGPLVVLNTSWATTVTIGWRYVREVHFLDVVNTALQPPPCPPMPERPGKFMILKFASPLEYGTYAEALKTAKAYVKNSNGQPHRVVRVLADVSPPPPTDTVVTTY